MSSSGPIPEIFPTSHTMAVIRCRSSDIEAGSVRLSDVRAESSGPRQLSIGGGPGLERADLPGRVARDQGVGRDIAHDHRGGRDNAPPADRDAGEDDASRTDPD